MEMKFLKEAIHNAPYGIFVADKLGNYLDVNQAACEITGYTEAELVGMNLLDLIPNEDKGKAQQNFSNLKKSSSANITIDFYTKSGDRRTWKVKAVKLDDNRYIGFTEDITEQKKLEEKIKYEKTKVEKYFETANIMFIVLDKEGNVQDINKKGCEILEYSRKDIIGKNWFNNFIPQSNIKEVKSIHDKVLSGKTNYVEFYENSITTSKGEERIISWHNNTIRDDSGQISFVVSAGNDITEQKKVEEEIRKSQKILKTIINTIPVRVFWKDRDLKYLGCNKQFALDAGFNEPDEVIGKDDYSMGWKDQVDLYRSDDLQVMGSGIKKLLIEEPQTTPDGKTIWLMTNKVPLLDSAGNIAGILGVYMDVTKRKQTEEELVESKKKFKDLFDFAPVPYQSLDKDGKILFVNQAWSDLLGYDKDEVIGKYLGDFMTKDSKKDFGINFYKFEASGTACNTEYNIKTKDNHTLIINIRGNIVLDEEGKFKQTYCILHDVTQTRKMEQKLRESESRYKYLFEHSGVEAGYYKPDGTIVYFNQQAAQNLGNVAIDYTGKSIYELFPKKYADLYMTRITKAIKSDKPQKYEDEVNLLKGQQTFVSTYNRTLNDKNEVTGVQVTSIDITKEKEAELELIKSQAFLKAVLDNSQAGIAIAEPLTGKLLYVNRAGLLITNNSEEYLVENIDYHKYIESEYILHLDGTPYKEDEVPLTRATVYGEEVTEEFIIRRDNLEDKIILAKATAIRSQDNRIIAGIVVFLDITEQKTKEKERAMLENHLRNQQKLESIGTLASGVAHEINNPINGILNYGQIILDSDIEDKSIKKYAGEIISETERIAKIVKNLLEFSRQNKEEHSYAKIEDVILKTLSLVNTIFKHDQIEMNLDIEEDLPKIKCRSQQVQQVIMNLVTNARDALNQKYPGYDENKKINIRCESYALDDKNWLRLTVKDYGTGISKDVIDYIFDPFFTTKGKFKGTGLGLSISYGIVKEHHGDISVESEEGKFTRFIVNLPCDNGWGLE